MKITSRLEKKMEQQIVVFELANEHYGVDIASVESIVKLQSITNVPQAPSFVEGVTNLRGSVLPVIDLRKRFGLQARDISKDSRIVVVSLNKTKVGMIVDSVSEVLRIPEETIEPAPPMVTSVNSSFITGIAKVDHKLIILLDLGKILSSKEETKISKLEAALV
jgi:purine-binding chemotaxis protein CheW